MPGSRVGEETVGAPRRRGQNQEKNGEGEAQISRFFPVPSQNFVLSLSLSGSVFRGIASAVQGHGPPKVRISAYAGVKKKKNGGEGLGGSGCYLPCKKR